MRKRPVDRPSRLETDFARGSSRAGSAHVRAGFDLGIFVPLFALAFHDATVTTATGFFYPKEIDIAVELVEEYLAKGPASGYHFLFIDRGEQTVAYLCFGPIPCTTGSFDIYWVATDPQQQGQGLGSQLLAAAEKQIVAQGGRQIFIETSSRPRYEPTRNFYARRGYEVVATLSDFYDLDDDKVVFRKRLI